MGERFSRAGNEDKTCLRLKYATKSADDAEPIESDKANVQARCLAEEHQHNINGTRLQRLCAVYEQNSIVIRDLAIDVARLIVETEQCTVTVFVEGEKHYKLLRHLLRLSDSSINRLAAEGDLIPMQIKTKIEFAEWKSTVGTKDRNPNKHIASSRGKQVH